MPRSFSQAASRHAKAHALSAALALITLFAAGAALGAQPEGGHSRGPKPCHGHWCVPSTTGQTDGSGTTDTTTTSTTASAPPPTPTAPTSTTTAAPDAPLVWTGDYETGDFSQYEQVLSNGRDTSASIVTSPTTEGRYAARFTLGPDTVDGYSRIEAHQPDRTKSGGRTGSESWYAFAEYIPSATGFAAHAEFNHLVQWHPTELPDGSGCTGSSLTVNGRATPPHLILRIKGGQVLTETGGCDTATDVSFDLGVVPRDVWLAFVLHVKWSPDPSVGFVELTLNGKTVVPFQHLSTQLSQTNTYFREGLYRFACSCTTTVYGDAVMIYSR